MLSVVATSFWGSPLLAQSTQMGKPTPLGAGVNSGNADSMAGTHYYYFFAGPGAFRVSMAFKSKGVFGNPLRESLDFDFYDEEGKMISHNAVVSLDKLERLETGGEYADRRKLILAVIPQKALIRTGGRYEIEAKGAVWFDAGAPVRAEGRPAGEEPLVKSAGPLVKPGGALVQPAGPLVKPAAPLVQASGPLVQSSGPLVQPGGPLVHSAGPLVHPVVVRETPREIRVTLASDVLFDFDQAVIRPDAAAALRQAADILRARSRGGVIVEGHTDSKGTADYNARLSAQRALAVEMWLVNQTGFPPSRFRTQAFGATHPVAPNIHPDGSDDPQGQQRNRRVELVFLK